MGANFDLGYINTHSNCSLTGKTNSIKDNSGHPSTLPTLNAFENSRSKTTIEKGQIFIEVYNKDGRLIRKTPPGYLPLD